jgi:UDP-N-acetylmuramoyl-tripeptide--D-alanyl-D-alanine ligase
MFNFSTDLKIMENRLFDLFYSCNQKVSTDSRKIDKGCLYVALKGEHFDGNEYAKSAIENGARFAIVDNPAYADNTSIFLVNNGLIFLQQLANYHRNKFSIPIIGITGSNGKTTSKELIASVLIQSLVVHYTQGNLNNHIGVPLTLLGLNNEHDIAIIEMGANKPGDIAELAAIAEPTHGIITNIGAAHLEGFGGFEGVLKTKTELYSAIENIGGTLFCNADDEILVNALPKNIEVVLYSGENNENASICGELVNMDPFVNFKWNNATYSSPTLATNIIGRYNFYNFLAAISIGDYFDIAPETINTGITSYKPDNNRSQIIETGKNTLIMDAYNANPTSVKSALISFKEMQHEKKLFILGDMYELGDTSLELHQEIVDLTISLGLEGVFIGEIYNALRDNYSNRMFFADKSTAMEFLATASPNKNLILLKGSRGMKLEEIKNFL